MQISNQTDKEVGYRILGVPTSPEEDLAVAAQRLVQAFEHYVKTQLVVLDRVARGEVGIGQEPPPAALEGARSVATEPGVPVGVRLGHTIVGPLAPAVRNGLDDAEREG